MKANATHEAGGTSSGTKIKTDKSDADKLADAKAAVTAALNGFTATNAADANAMIALANKAISDAGITGVTVSWDASGAFSKIAATENTAGSVTGTIKLSCGAANDTVAFNKPIAKLPSDPNAKIATVKAAIEAALNAYTPSNTATAADIKAIADKANTDSGIIGVTVAWGTPSFNNTNSTNPNPPTTVETKVPATVDKNGNATVNVTDKTMQDAIDKAVAEAKKNGTSGNGVAVVISVTTGGKDANTVTVNLPKTVQEKVIAGNVVNTVVVVDRPEGMIPVTGCTMKTARLSPVNHMSSIQLENS